MDRDGIPLRKYTFSDTPYVEGFFTTGPIIFPAVLDDRSAVQINAYTSGQDLPLVVSTWDQPATLGD